MAALNCETVQSMAIPSGAPGSSVLQRAPVQDLRARNSAMTSEDPPVSREFGLHYFWQLSLTMVKSVTVM